MTFGYNKTHKYYQAKMEKQILLEIHIKDAEQ